MRHHSLHNPWPTATSKIYLHPSSANLHLLYFRRLLTSGATPLIEWITLEFSLVSRLRLSPYALSGTNRLPRQRCIQIIISIYNLACCGLKARDVSVVVHGIVEMNGAGHASIPRDWDKRMKRTRNAKCGANEPCLSHWGPIVMEDYKEYGTEEILNSKFTRRKCILPSQMERVVRWSYNWLDVVDGMSWIAPILCTNSISVTLISRRQGSSISQSISLHSAAWVSTLLSHPPLLQANTFDCQMPHEENTLPRPSPSRPNQCPQLPQCSLFLSQSPTSYHFW